MDTIQHTHLDGGPIVELTLSALRQPATDIAKAAGIDTVRQVGLYRKGDSHFFFEFENHVPQGELRALFPAMELEELLAEGWEYLAVELHLSVQKVTFGLRGKYFREPVPLEFNFTLTQGPSGYVKDQISITDLRIDETENTTFKDIMEIRLKSGDPKYAGSNDVYGALPIQRIVKILNRFVRDWTVSHRIIERH